MVLCSLEQLAVHAESHEFLDLVVVIVVFVVVEQSASVALYWQEARPLGLTPAQHHAVDAQGAHHGQQDQRAWEEETMPRSSTSLVAQNGRGHFVQIQPSLSEEQDNPKSDLAQREP